MRARNGDGSSATFTSSEDLDREEIPILFLEIEITSWPHTENEDTPSV